MFTEKVVINQGLTDINPLLCGRERCKNGHAFGPAARDYILLHFVVSGKGMFSTSRGRYELGENKVFVIRPNEITYYKADELEPWEYIWIGFTATDNIKSIFCRQDVISALDMREIFLACYGEVDSQNGGAGYEAFLCAKLWEIAALLQMREKEAVKSVDSYVKSAVDIMESEYATGISVSEISKRLHLNRSYFSTLFSESMGVAPITYLTDIRMKRALSLMQDFGYNVSVTALSVGYSDVFGFSRAFKKYYGKSPYFFCK